MSTPSVTHAPQASSSSSTPALTGGGGQEGDGSGPHLPTVPLSSSSSSPFLPQHPPPPPPSTLPPLPQVPKPNASSASTPGPGPLASRHVEPDRSATPVTKSETTDDDTTASWGRMMAGKKRRWAQMGLDAACQDEMEGRVVKYHLALALDQLATTHAPAKPARFSSERDVVERLMPWHVWQIHDEELEGQEKGDKKRKREERELGETRWVLDKMTSINKRFAAVRTRDAQHPSPLPDLISLLRSSTLILREEISALEQPLREKRAEYHRLESARRAEVEKRERQEAAEERARLENERARAMLVEAAKPKPKPGPTPIPATTPTSTPAPTSVAADNDAVRGRPRGRPRGSGRAGRRETTVTHADVKGTPTAAAAVQGTPGKGTGPTVANGGSASKAPATPTPAAAVTQGPVSITVGINLLPQLVNLGILVIPAKPTGPKPPAMVVRTTEDKKSAVLNINLGQCTQTQLAALAKMLNVSARPGAAAAGGGGGGTPRPTAAASNSPAKADPSKGKDKV